MSQMSWFDDEGKKEFTPLEAGLYKVRVNNITCDEVQGQEAKLSVEFILDNKRRVWQNFRFKDTQKKFINWQMQMLGIYEEAKTLAQGGLAPHRAFVEAGKKALGAQCEIEISYRDYNGKSYQNVKIESCDLVYDQASPSIDTDEKLPF